MSRTYRLYLNDILKAIEKIDRYTQDIEIEVFKADDMRVDSVLHNLMIIGEAVKNIPDDVREKEPEVRWRDIGRFRDRVVHHYFAIDLDIIWEIVQDHLPPLLDYVTQLLEEEENNDDLSPSGE